MDDSFIQQFGVKIPDHVRVQLRDAFERGNVTAATFYENFEDDDDVLYKRGSVTCLNGSQPAEPVLRNITELASGVSFYRIKSMDKVTAESSETFLKYVKSKSKPGCISLPSHMNVISASKKMVKRSYDFGFQHAYIHIIVDNASKQTTIVGGAAVEEKTPYLVLCTSSPQESQILYKTAKDATLSEMVDDFDKSARATEDRRDVLAFEIARTLKMEIDVKLGPVINDKVTNVGRATTCLRSTTVERIGNGGAVLFYHGVESLMSSAQFKDQDDRQLLFPQTYFGYGYLVTKTRRLSHAASDAQPILQGIADQSHGSIAKDLLKGNHVMGKNVKNDPLPIVESVGDGVNWDIMHERQRNPDAIPNPLKFQRFLLKTFDDKLLSIDSDISLYKPLLCILGNPDHTDLSVRDRIVLADSTSGDYVTVTPQDPEYVKLTIGYARLRKTDAALPPFSAIFDESNGKEPSTHTPTRIKTTIAKRLLESAEDV